MLLSCISPETHLLFEKNSIPFKMYRNDDEKKPTPEECKGVLKGVFLSYAFCGEQDYGIQPMAIQFGATDKNRTITEIPEKLEIIESEGVKAIKFGSYAKLDSVMIRTAKESGVISYWDKENFIICASSEYKFVIDSIVEIFKPNHARFGFINSFDGPNLLILAI